MTTGMEELDEPFPTTVVVCSDFYTKRVRHSRGVRPIPVVGVTLYGVVGKTV